MILTKEDFEPKFTSKIVSTSVVVKTPEDVLEEKKAQLRRTKSLIFQFGPFKIVTGPLSGIFPPVILFIGLILITVFKLRFVN